MTRGCTGGAAEMSALGRDAQGSQEAGGGGGLRRLPRRPGRGGGRPPAAVAPAAREGRRRPHNGAGPAADLSRRWVP
jgi:hypothetical protein